MLVKRGHDVYFAHYLPSKSSIEKNGIKFISLADHQHSDYKVFNELPAAPHVFEAKIANSMKYSPLEMVSDETIARGENLGWIMLLELSKGENYSMLNIIDQLKPDICLADYLWVMPWMVKVNLPVVPVMSSSPNDLYYGPPLGSGYSVYDSPKLWDEYRTLVSKGQLEFDEKRKKVFEFFKVDCVSRTFAKQLGIYIYPGPLDYHELELVDKNWVRLDSAVRIPETSDFHVPEKIANLPGRLIYISMGTLASMVPKMLNIILEPLANIPHRFIVSKGSNGDSVNLHDNMWGDKFVDQVAILPKVDLFITHGGSNSLIEGLVAGKPLIVIPQFGDQHNNAQRIVDLKLGSKVNLWEFSGDKLVNQIDYVLNNEEINQNVLKVSNQLKNSDSSDKVCSLIENLAKSQNSSTSNC